jgi:hypothetical protein
VSGLNLLRAIGKSNLRRVNHLWWLGPHGNALKASEKSWEVAHFGGHRAVSETLMGQPLTSVGGPRLKRACLTSRTLTASLKTPKTW